MAAQQHIEKILDNYLNNRYTKEEYNELIAYFDISADDEEAKDLLLRAIVSIDNRAVSEERIERVTDNAFQILQKRIQMSQPTLIRRMIPYAAAILLFLSIGIYWSIHSVQTNDVAVLTSEFGGDALPGGNKAYITLSDGHRIALDSTQTVLMSDNGKHVYGNGTELIGSSDAEFVTISTPVGGTYRVTLSDGTKAWLNSQSSLHYPTTFDGSERRVETTGEVYLEVASDRDKPFIVRSQGQDIQVLGTAFNIRSYGANTITTLVHGKIALTTHNSQKQVILRPGNQAILKEGNINVSDIDPADFITWRDGIILNKDASLLDICQELERWYGVHFIFPRGFDNTDRAIISIDRNEKLSSFLAALRNSYNVEFQINGKEVFVR